MMDIISPIISILAEEETTIDNSPNWIIEFLIALITGFIRNLMQPLISFFYIVCIWAPLQVLNALVIMFKYFGNGFTYAIFGSQSGIVDGQVQISFSWNSQLGMMLLMVFIIAIIFFFITFLLTFTQNTVVDETGKPSMMQSKRLFYLKWPLYMVLLLVGTPFLLVIMDNFMTVFLGMFNNDQSNPLDTYTVNTFSSYVYTGSLADSSLYATIYRYNTSDIVLEGKSLSGYFFATANALGVLSQEARTAGLSNISNLFDSYNKSAMNIFNFSSGTGEFSSMFGDLENIKLNLSPGGFLSDAEAKMMIRYSGRVQSFINQLTDFRLLYDKMLFTSSYHVQYEQLLGMPSSATQLEELTTSLQNYQTQIKTLNSPLASVYVGDKSYAWQFATGDANIPGLMYMHRFTKLAFANSNLCGIIYQYASGDSNAENWRFIPQDGIYDTSVLYTNLLAFAMTCVMTMGTILIVYQYTRAAIQRSFYILFYYIIGWLFLANGIKESQSAAVWYKQLYGRWISVIVMYSFFELSLAAFTIFQPIIYSALNDVCFYVIDGIKYRLGANFGVLMTLEATLTIAWTICQTVTDDLWKTKEEKWTGAKSMLMTEGKQLKNNMIDNAKQVSSFVGDRFTFKGTRDAFVWSKDSHQYWRDRLDTKRSRSLAFWMRDERRAAFADKQFRANSLGYHLVAKQVRGEIMGPKTYEYSLVQMNEKEKKEFAYRHGKGVNPFDRNKNKDYTTDEFKRTYLNQHETDTDMHYGDAQAIWGPNGNRPDNFQRDKDGHLHWVDNLDPEGNPQNRTRSNEAYAQKACLESYLRTHQAKYPKGTEYEGQANPDFNKEDFTRGVEELKAVNEYIDGRMHNDNFSGEEGYDRSFVNKDWVRTHYKNLESHITFAQANREAFGGQRVEDPNDPANAPPAAGDGGE